MIGTSIFAAIWDSARGVSVIDLYPEQFPFGAEEIASNIFMTQQMFGSEEKQKEQDISLYTIAIGKFNRIARVLFERGSVVHVYALLLPDYFSDDQATQFDGILKEIAQAFRLAGEKPPSNILSKYITQIDQIFALEQNIHDAEILVDPKYDLPLATQEFQQGLTEFKGGNLTRAYYLLRRAGGYFETSGQKKFGMEVLYILGSILVQQKKYQTAQQYFVHLHDTAEELQTQKYQEQGLFMAGYCAYQREAYREAQDFFQKLEKISLNFVSRAKFHFFYGQSLARGEEHKKAIQYFLQVLEQHETGEKDDVAQRINAQSLQALGMEYYKHLAQEMQRGFMKMEAIRSDLTKAIDYFKAAADVWQKIGDHVQVIQIYEMLATIYGVLGLNIVVLEYYEKALDLSEKANDLPQKFRIFQRIVQKEAELGMHKDLLQKIDKFLGTIGTHAYVDLVTIGRLHYQLGLSLVQLEKVQDALSEFLIALTIFRKTGTLFKEQAFVLRAMIDACHKRGERDAEKLYADSLKEVTAQIKEEPVVSRRAVGGLNGIIKEIWIYMKTGIEVFIYAPESRMDGELLGGFLLAFQNFSKEVTSQNLKAMAIGPNYYAIHADPVTPYFIMGRANINCVPEEVENALRVVNQTFFARYENDLIKFDGNKTPFEQFAFELEKIVI